ncbi:maleylpyruvate isomerase N-terminal domain-containing protein [Micromonospora sp. NPDC002296]|uniref:maleylpyruvate isomerase N-terminal domain-containing protein n=1 Tax=Micromonospora sp. NPDC002296 TaxID=3154271 RepID=UPI0033292253
MQAGGAHVRAATDAMLGALRPHTGRDWTVPAGTLQWSCWATAAHLAHDLLAYAGQVAGRPSGGYLPFDLTVSPAATPAEVLAVAAACGGLLATALDAADPGLRAWHFGSCDPAGFAAMGVAEALLHAHDVARGLGVTWQLPDRLAAVALDRLFPEAPPGPPAQVLLWMTGRTEFDGRPRRTSWTWQAALP